MQLWPEHALLRYAGLGHVVLRNHYEIAVRRADSTRNCAVALCLGSQISLRDV